MVKTYSVVNASYTVVSNAAEVVEVQGKDSQWTPVVKFAKLAKDQVFRTSSTRALQLSDHYVKIGYLKLVSAVEDPPAPAPTPEPAPSPVPTPSPESVQQADGHSGEPAQEQENKGKK